MSTLRVSHVKTRDDVVWVVFLCCGVCVCVCVCEPSSYEAQRESPARPRPGRSIAAPFRVCAFSRAFPIVSAAAPSSKVAKSALRSVARVARPKLAELRGLPRIGRQPRDWPAWPQAGHRACYSCPRTLYQPLSPSPVPVICPSRLLPSTAPPSPTHLWPPLAQDSSDSTTSPSIVSPSFSPLPCSSRAILLPPLWRRHPSGSPPGAVSSRAPLLPRSTSPASRLVSDACSRLAAHPCTHLLTSPSLCFPHPPP